jgi:hypothetical protein
MMKGKRFRGLVSRALTEISSVPPVVLVPWFNRLGKVLVVRRGVRFR